MKALKQLNVRPQKSARIRPPPLAHAIRISLEDERMKWSLSRFKTEEQYRQIWAFRYLSELTDVEFQPTHTQTFLAAVKVSTNRLEEDRLQEIKFKWEKELLEFEVRQSETILISPTQRMEEPMPIPPGLKEYETAPPLRIPDTNEHKLGPNRLVKDDRLFFSDLFTMMFRTGRSFAVSFLRNWMDASRKADTYSVLAALNYIHTVPTLSRRYHIVHDDEDEEEKRDGQSSRRGIVNADSDLTLYVDPGTEKKGPLVKKNYDNYIRLEALYGIDLTMALAFYQTNFETLQTLFSNQFDLDRFFKRLNHMDQSEQEVSILQNHFKKMGVLHPDGSNREIIAEVSKVWNKTTKALWDRYCVAVDRLENRDRPRPSPLTTPVLGPDGVMLYPIGYFRDIPNPNDQTYRPVRAKDYVTIPREAPQLAVTVSSRVSPVRVELPPYQKSDNSFYDLFSHLPIPNRVKAAFDVQFSAPPEWEALPLPPPVPVVVRIDPSRSSRSSQSSRSSKSSKSMPETLHPYDEFVRDYLDTTISKLKCTEKEAIDRLRQEFSIYEKERQKIYQSQSSLSEIKKKLDRWDRKFFEDIFLVRPIEIERVPILADDPGDAKGEKASRYREKATRFLTNTIQKRAPLANARNLAERVEEGVFAVFQRNMRQALEKRVYKNPTPDFLFNAEYLKQIGFIAGCLGNPANQLVDLLVSDRIDPGRLAEMNRTELITAEERIKLETLQQLAQRFEDDSNPVYILQGLETNQFWCRGCNTNKTHYIERQTRSADEPMTIFVRCDNCGKQWRQ